MVFQALVLYITSFLATSGTDKVRRQTYFLMAKCEVREVNFQIINCNFQEERRYSQKVSNIPCNLRNLKSQMFQHLPESTNKFHELFTTTISSRNSCLYCDFR